MSSSPYRRGHHPNSRNKKPGSVNSRDRRNKTGCVGVNLTSEHVRRTHDTVTRYYFQANCGKQKRRFRIDTLGKAAAFRAALQWRAERERAAKQTTISEIP
jgi:hypothetical protein